MLSETQPSPLFMEEGKRVRPNQPRAPQSLPELVDPSHTALIVVDLQND